MDWSDHATNTVIPATAAMVVPAAPSSSSALIGKSVNANTLSSARSLRASVRRSPFQPRARR